MVQMSLRECSQPSLEMTGRVSSRPRVISHRLRVKPSRTAAVTPSRPKLSLDTTVRQAVNEARPRDVPLGQRLEPHRLPDAGRRRVENPLGLLLPVLLAA